jgi:hypothetical protein
MPTDIELSFLEAPTPARTHRSGRRRLPRGRCQVHPGCPPGLRAWPTDLDTCAATLQVKGHDAVSAPHRSARPSASQKGIGKTPDVALLPNLAMYENQGGACGATGPASAPALPLSCTPGAHRATQSYGRHWISRPQAATQVDSVHSPCASSRSYGMDVGLRGWWLVVYAV